MIDEIFRVTRDEYVGFLDQIKLEYRHVVQEEDDNQKAINVYSNLTNKLLCSRVIPKGEDSNESFYVIDMPDPIERCEPKPKRRLVLKTREEVQAFFDIINKIQKTTESK